MWLKKDSGGTTIRWEGRDYHWPAADPVCEVPQELGEVLLGIRGAGYAEVPAPPKPAPAASKATAAKADGPAQKLPGAPARGPDVHHEPGFGAIAG